MGRIVQLDDRLSNMIAAGEVVERPSSVVKELVENAIDAGSTQITINLIDSGVKEILVTDNGCGMSQADAKLCFSRHATSKIKNEYDLFRIKTLGFRGEAIPSIASVSTFTLITNDGNESTKVVYKAGHLEDVCTHPANKGTQIKVENLFFNVPARLKYLKSLPQELSSITYLVSKFILANPNISFTLTNNGKVIYKTLGNGDLVRIFGELYGLEVAKNLLTSNFQGHGFKIELVLCKSVISRANKLEITTIVNDRYVRNNIINQAVIDGYHTYLPDGRFPIALVKIEIDPLLIDVNVHPTKTQIKISNEELMAQNIEENVKSLLKEATIIPQVSAPVETPKKSYEKTSIFDEILPTVTFKEPEVERKPIDTSAIDSLLAKTNSYQEELVEVKEEKPVLIEQETKKPAVEKKSTLPYLEYCGQVHGTYLIFQNEEGMYLMDQHAAAERINYEYYLNVLTNPSNVSQPMLMPINIDFTAGEMISLEEHIHEFEDLGFKMNESGQNSYFVREIPMWLHAEDTSDFIRKVLYSISRDRQFKIEKYRDKIAAEIACKASIKANHKISREEIDALVEKLRMCENPFTCPHGRPTIIKYSTLELEKLFKRVN